MTNALVEVRVSSLESMVAELVQVSMATQRNVDRLVVEMREFKDEMADFKDEMKEFKDEMADFKDEMKEFKDEMADFKDESRRKSSEADERLEKHILENRLMVRDMNRRWGEIANKQGRMTEDLVAPSIGRIIQELVGGSFADLDDEAVRVKRRHRVTRERREFDAVAECGSFVLVNETKSNLTPGDVDAFVGLMADIRSYFPQYADKKILGSLATLYADPSLVRYASARGIVVLAVGDELMDIQNERGFVPAEF